MSGWYASYWNAFLFWIQCKCSESAIASVTLMLCSHLTSAFASTSPSKFNIASMVMQTKMQSMGQNPFSASMLI